ncbi:MAG: hypothetical protein LBG80_05300 [Bacteroidales bacterium]|jgi:hypothetical protein|nr:hypothetical protein [Bacteroidales bacterium]
MKRKSIVSIATIIVAGVFYNTRGNSYNSIIMKSITYFMLFVMFFSSCGSKKTIEEKDQKILDLPEESVKGSLTKFFEIESIVPIETDDELFSPPNEAKRLGGGGDGRGGKT